MKNIFFAITCFYFLQTPSWGANFQPCQTNESAPALPPIELKAIAKSLRSPVGLTHSRDHSGRLFIIEQGGTIRVLEEGKVLPEPFLDIRKQVDSGGEKGLLGLAFHPQFSKNKKFYINYTRTRKGLHTVISEFKTGRNKNQADPKSQRILMTIPQPYGNHNGGNIAFGPDGYLYIGMGDGGSANDPQNNGQKLSTLLGKMLRIDVDQKGKEKPYSIPPDNPFLNRKDAEPEIWAPGLRNPWRFSFDFSTGLLYAGDVGQSAREEINIVQSGKNYGWRTMEGTICTPRVKRNCKKQGLVLPIWDYPRSQGTTVIGGFVYRGHSIPNLCGTYLYADFGNGKIFGFRPNNKKPKEVKTLLETGRLISSFGEDEKGELYITDLKGDILQLIPAITPQK
ncbi:MAG TPA: PQQ-dependent sugar dehydrogenase [Nitrospiria bacterium]|jgi:glucose/arabinose dehydrogenase